MVLARCQYCSSHNLTGYCTMHKNRVTYADAQGRQVRENLCYLHGGRCLDEGMGSVCCWIPGCQSWQTMIRSVNWHGVLYVGVPHSRQILRYRAVRPENWLYWQSPIEQSRCPTSINHKDTVAGLELPTPGDPPPLRINSGE